MSRLQLIWGTVCLILAGLLAVAVVAQPPDQAVQSLEGPILLIILGAHLAVQPWFDERQLLGRAGGS